MTKLDKIKARRKVAYAIRMGYITKPTTCSRCSSTEYIHGHHEDYTKPLELIWLCRDCHYQHHQLTKPIIEVKLTGDMCLSCGMRYPASKHACNPRTLAAFKEKLNRA